MYTSSGNGVIICAYNTASIAFCNPKNERRSGEGPQIECTDRDLELRKKERCQFLHYILASENVSMMNDLQEIYRVLTRSVGSLPGRHSYLFPDHHLDILGRR